jgi:hypothetical protein
VVESDAPVLSRAARPRLRVVAFVVVLAAVVVWDAVAPHLDPVSVWWEVAIIAAAVLPATLLLIYLALPLWSHRRLVAIGFAVFLIAAVLTWHTHHYLASNFMKLGAYTCGGWMFLWLFEELAWVVLIALVIPVVDSISVAAGPTHTIVTHHFAVYSAVAVAFVAPGGRAAGLGPPDILFFALFLAAADRFGLRVFWTWLALCLSFGATLAIAVGADISGLPALPGLSIAFLAVNIDLLWPTFRRGWAYVSRGSRASP